IPPRLLPFLSLAAGVLATFVLMLEPDWVTKFLSVTALIAALSFLSLKANIHLSQIEELTHLRAAYDQLDHQAKLIIRTDLELHHTQEELDRKLASLFALHELSQQLRVSLHPDEIYGQITAQLITSFGFSKGLVGVCPTPGQLTWRALIGVNEHEAQPIHQHLLISGLLHDVLINPSPRTLSPATALTQPAGRQVLDLLSTTTVVAAGVVPQAGPAGCLFLSREGRGVGEGRGDEELVAILTTQLAIAVENSAFYEALRHTRQELEAKVQERTQELADTNAQLIRLNKAKSNFVSAVSHELRTPLAAIKGYSALLRGGQFGSLTPAQAERLAKIEKHADLLTQLINNLLDIARIESGRVVMEQQPIKVDELIATVLEMVKPQLDAKRIHLTTQVDGVTQFLGDPTHLPRVFMNLLSNALKYTPEGGTIAVILQRDERGIIAKIQDSGCGITPEELPNLFQEFYRTSSPINQEVRGTGLGLVLTKRIVEAHHGQIWVDSVPGKGTIFTFMLPAP
ncbi:MAG: HAMP domain-containing histidine kinase, partial [Candidatus Omnitrophica bacterium]|nr:HAMP domain-containing histidine kinase [Candidatus Omnitrophota bacterium]